jgi:hypothetical protein
MEHELLKSYQVNYSSYISSIVRLRAQNPSLQSLRAYYVYISLAVFMAHVHIVKTRYF